MNRTFGALDPTLTPGFTDPVHQAHTCFRAILLAMSSPGCIVNLPVTLHPPIPFSSASAAILLTLTDSATPINVAAATEYARRWIDFHCSAPQSDLAQADFVFAAQRPALASLKQGSEETPETSASLILDLPHFIHGRRYRLSGPGIETSTLMQAPLDEWFVTEWNAMYQRAPCGIDLILCAERQIIALPRSIKIEEY